MLHLGKCTYNLSHGDIFLFHMQHVSKSKLLKAGMVPYFSNAQSIMSTHSCLKLTNSNYKRFISLFFWKCNHHINAKLDP